MSDTTEKLQRELQAAQHALAEARARCEQHDAEHLAAAKEMEDNRKALLFMLEDLEAGRRKVELAHHEWIAALDVVNDPIFLHDREFRILRCNKAYQQRAGIPFKQIIGQPYYEIFPKTDGPLPCCKQTMETAEKMEEEVGVGDAIYRSRTFSIHDEQGAYLYSVHVLEDITEKRKVGARLQLFHDLLDQTSDGISIADSASSRFLYVNQATCHNLGYTREELLQRGVIDIQTELTDAAAWQAHVQMLRTKDFAILEYEALRKDGSRFPIENNLRYVATADGGYIVAVVRDITERKRAEAVLHESEEKFRKIGESAQDAIIMMGADQRISFWNTAAKRIFGYTSEETMGQELHDLIVPAPASARFTQAFPHFQQTGEGAIIGKVIEITALRKGGEEFPVELCVSATRLGGKWHAIGIVRDITGRKRAESEFIKTRNRAQHYLDIAGVMLVSIDVQGKVQLINRKGCEMLGYPEADILGKDWFDNYLPEPVRKETRKVFDQILDGNVISVEHHENKILTSSGDTLVVAWHNAALLDESGKINGVLSSGEDITERKLAEDAIQHANRALATLSTVNRTLVRATSEGELLQAICEAIVQQHGYRLAWVGYIQHDENKTIKIMAHASTDGGYPDTMQPTWAEEKQGMGPCGRAARSGVTQICQDIASDPHYHPWRDEALKRGYAASIALPLQNADNTVRGILTVYANEVNAFNPGEISLLEEMAGDLAFGVNSLHVRRERDLAMEQSQLHFVKLHKSMEDTVQAIASMVEMRDPYTAGHQARVAGLAAAIAKQIGLPDEQVHAIHLAGTVHDLGKIKIPAEILSKPGRITDIERSLIGIHPQAGFDILKGIEFPWPIAQMVLQHHERLDGSGYPQGLKGEQIILEARILSVADVVEAISSHRPYRPGLGVDAALEEITKQRGTHYDAAVVSACLALFREQHYKFQPASFK